jgi:ATP-dependent Clp protease protease subunit
MEKIDISAPLGARKDRFFARTSGTSFAIRAADDGGSTIDLYDEIGYWGVDSKTFRARLMQTSGDVTLRINSGGGDVFDGLGIYNDLIAYDGKVKVEIIGMAASIASIIAMAGDEIVMAPNAFIMIHDAWSIGVGNRHEMKKMSDTLTKIDDALARTYAARTTTGIRAIKDMMDEETWFSAKDAVDAGFATSIAEGAISPDGAKAKFDLSAFSNTPKSLLYEESDFVIETEEDIEKLIMRDAGKTRSQARALIRDIRAGTTSKPETKPGAGGVELSKMAAALSEARAAFHNTIT